MEYFEHSFTVQGSEQKVTQSLWDYYLYIYAPRIIRMIYTALCFLVFGLTDNTDFSLFFFMISGTVFCIFLLEFPVFRNRVLNVIKPMGTLENESFYHLYETKYITRCGENENTAEYRSFTGYFRFKNKIFLLMGNQLFSGCFAESVLEGKEEAFIAALEKSGVKRVKFFALKRWAFTLAVILFFALYFICSYSSLISNT